MKQFLLFSFALVALFGLLAGCDLVTNKPAESSAAVGRDLVINEVFSISPDKYYAYSWMELYNPSPKSLALFDVTSPITGYLIGEGGTIRKTSDNGRTWADLASGTSQNLNAISMVFPDTGFAIGDGGTFLKTVDSGKTWNSLSDLNTSLNLNAMWMPSVYQVQNAQVAVIGADSGYFWRTTNRGRVWTKTSSGTKRNIRSVTPAWSSNLGVTDIWACGDSGLVVRTSTVGATWIPISSAWNQVNMTAICVTKGADVARDTAYVAGSDGRMYRVYGSAGALVLDTSFTGTGARLNGITTYAGRQWVVGDSGYIYYKSAVNVSWHQQGSNVTTANLRSVYFADTSRGFIFGDNGTLLSTTDGGVFWNVISSGTSKNLRGGSILPIVKTIRNYYALKFTAKRKEFYADPFTGRVNFDFFTKIDSGDVNITLVPNSGKGRVAPGAFVVVYNDSAKFGDHTKLGPAGGVIFNALTAFYTDNTVFGGKSVRWDLLGSGEVTLLRYHIETRDSVFTISVNGATITRIFQILVSSDSTVLDVVRYGNYKPTGVDPYPANIAMPPVAEGSSITRWQDDIGFDDPRKMNTSYSFYVTTEPIPLWGSQLRRNK